MKLGKNVHQLKSRSDKYWCQKFTVADMLTIGKQYDVINETEEYYQIIDNSGLVGGYYKDYFKEI